MWACRVHRRSFGPPHERLGDRTRATHRRKRRGIRMKRMLFVVVLAAAGCSSQEQSNARGAEPAAVSRDADRSSVSRDADPSVARPSAKTQSDGSSSGAPAPKKEERGNTPPGQTRAGEAPAAGAI